MHKIRNSFMLHTNSTSQVTQILITQEREAAQVYGRSSLHSRGIVVNSME